MRTWYANATVFTGHDMLEEHGLVVEGGRVVDVTTEAPQHDVRVDLAGALIAPGFVDLQVNGGGGVMFNDDPSPAGLERIASAHRAFGTTAFLPTFISGPLEGMRAARAAVDASSLDEVIGIHFEGPSLDVEKRGAHAVEHLRPLGAAELDVLARDRSDTLLTLSERHLAPLLDDARLQNIRLSLGHTAATYDEARRAFAGGISMVTHLFNAMTPLQSRAPGVVGAALAADDVTAGIIVDGIHVDPAAVQLAYRCKPPGKLILVTDAISVVGSDASEVRLGGQTVRVIDGRCVNEEGNLAGSALDMASAVRNAVTRCGIPLADALRMASTWPARFWQDETRGVLRADSRADFVVLDAETLEVRSTAVAGRLA